MSSQPNRNYFLSALEAGIISWMTIMTRSKVTLYLFLCLVVFALVACNSSVQPSTQVTIRPAMTEISESVTVEPSLPVNVSPTPIPAALVNEELITMAEYQAEIARFHAASGTEIATITEKDVLNEMINQVLLAQGAQENGYNVDDAALQKRIDQLNISDQTLQDWLSVHGYTEDGFRQSFARAIAAAWMRDFIVGSLPETAEQIHARQILLYNADEAQTVYNELQSGADFATLARKYAPVTGGDLGWFPRGYLYQEELDPIVFSLEEGQFSEVVKTEVGYHIFQVIERDDQHTLNYDARRVIKRLAVKEWLKNKREQSRIIINVP